ncbi:GFA family protein [Bowmanella pacifica]|uniref:Aldehyde-activating protein n=1 Tax=Bowmanella pacifica TaxID=502051 RepID=A0A917YVF2_9ALTE|nr:GFA family protein [Bowmanella pacifica]GGO67496.1 aldehyde-activating protein [Bowmanella pacifica]
MTKKGSCLCGAVHFQIDGDFEQFFLCHCQHCQKDTGSAHAANLFSNTATLKWQKGEALVKTFCLPGTRHQRAFCTNCGSALPYLLSEFSMLVVPAGSLDDKVEIKPNAHLFMASRANWDDELEKVHKLDGLPGN